MPRPCQLQIWTCFAAGCLGHSLIFAHLHPYGFLEQKLFLILYLLSAIMGTTWSQLRPPAPQFTEKDIPSLDGEVIVVTGGNAGVGFELVKMLYTKGGCTIYIASRSTDRIATAIKEIKSIAPAPPQNKQTQLKSLRLDLNDLTTISESANQFLG